VTVITGFLGSGKTTLLNNLLKHPEMSQAAVIVNEFGEIGLDYDLVERSDENVVQLANGCLCCSVKGDLIDTFRDLHIQRNAKTIPYFDRVIIETTGIADPGPVLQIIFTNPMVMNHYALDGVVTTVDAINGIDSLSNFPECAKQVAIADRLIITKTDMTQLDNNVDQTKKLSEGLKDLNPAAPIIIRTLGEFDPEDLFGTGMFDATSKKIDFEAWIDPSKYSEDSLGSPFEPNDNIKQNRDAYYLEKGHTPEEHPNHNHDTSINTFCIIKKEAMSINMLRMFLEGLTNEAGPNLLRVKGIVAIEEHPERPAVIQGAQQIFHSLEFMDNWPSDDRRTRIVFITRDIDKNYIEETFSLIERVAKRTVEASTINP
jgi:G3E family GTPase|tara:strand:- start:487 stop:1605 length:1119 start_codon:yes stop_codon:yes gene_type:complete